MAPGTSFDYDRGRGGSRLVHKTPSASFVFDRGKNSSLGAVYILLKKKNK